MSVVSKPAQKQQKLPESRQRNHTPPNLDSMLPTLSEHILLSWPPSALGGGTCWPSPQSCSIICLEGMGSCLVLGPEFYHSPHCGSHPAAATSLSPQHVVGEEPPLSPFRGSCDLRKSNCHDLGTAGPAARINFLGLLQEQFPELSLEFTLQML